MASDEWALLRYSGSDEPRVTLGRLRDKRFAARELRPVLVLGPQRSRKTTGIVIPTLLDWPGPAIVTSVRTDVLKSTVAHRNRRGRSEIFDPSGELVQGYRTTGWDPLSDCKTWDDALRTARWLTEAAAISSAHIENADFWAQKATSLLAPLLFAAGATSKSMRDVIRWIRTGEEGEVVQLLEDIRGVEAINNLTSVTRADDRLRGNVYATLNNVTAVYDYSSVIEQTVRSDLDIAEFFNGNRNTLYLCAPPDEQEEFAPLFTSLVRRILREAYRRDISEQRPSAPLLVLLDEAGNIAPLANLDTLATTAAGTGIQLISVFHDLSQMATIYGSDKARTIANNHSALMLLPGNRDSLTSDLISNLLGDEVAQGWRDPVTGRPGPATGSPFRRLAPGTALCIYEHLSPLVLKLRSSTHDHDLLQLTSLREVDLPPEGRSPIAQSWGKA